MVSFAAGTKGIGFPAELRHEFDSSDNGAMNSLYGNNNNHDDDSEVESSANVPDSFEESSSEGDSQVDGDDEEGMDVTDQKTKEKKEIEKRLGRSETQTVRKLRILFLLTLLGVAIGVSVLVYLYTKDTEEDEFKNAYKGHGQKVLEAFQEDALQKMQALESLSTTITSHALEHNMTWPYIKVANSARLFGPYLRLADAAYLVLMPIVDSRQRAGWESHAKANLDWIEQDLAVAQEGQENNNNEAGDARRRELQYSTESQVSPYIKNYVGVDTSTGPWCVWWQVRECYSAANKLQISDRWAALIFLFSSFIQYAPIIENRFFVNFNRLAWKGFREQLNSIINGAATISQAVTYQPGLDIQSTRDFKFTQQLLQAGGGADYEAGEPLSYIDYPVFDNWSSNKKAVAVLSATIFWKSYFTGVLPEGVKVLAVIENNKGQSFTYQVE